MPNCQAMFHRVLWPFLALALVACGGSEGDDEDNDPVGNPSDPLNATRQACVDRINDFRATEGLPAYQRWLDAESCSDDEARIDSQPGQPPHSAFGQCGENAQNECPGWPSLEDTIQGCLQMMWDEGPGENFAQHGHYLNMSSTTYSMVSCGFHTTDSGSVWALQNFK